MQKKLRTSKVGVVEIKTVVVRKMPAQLWRNVKARAALENKTITDWLIGAILDKLAEEKKEDEEAR